MGSDDGTGFISLAWCLEFWGAPYIFVSLCSPAVTLLKCTSIMSLKIVKILVVLHTFSFLCANVLQGVVFSNTTLVAIPLRTVRLWQYLKAEIHESRISTSVLTSQKNSASPLQRSTAECFTEKQPLFFLRRVRNISALCRERTEFLLLR